ncbi:MAG: hypothetical protein JSS34_08685 [Proteobacteria bacterium]|nr:hypothetical protein [Pseudomonadota bacterium]
MIRKYKYLIGFLCLVLTADVFGEPSEKIRLAAHKILQSMRTPHIDFASDSPEDPFAIQIQQGKIDIVGNVSLNVLLGSCFSESEMNTFRKYFTDKFLQEHPNCVIEIMSHSCLYDSPLKKAACFLQRMPCKRQKCSEIKINLKCLLPIDTVDLFGKEERVYQ